jgi:hypothetical protein
MDKITGMSNAFADVLATLTDDTLFQETELPEDTRKYEKISE